MDADCVYAVLRLEPPAHHCNHRRLFHDLLEQHQGDGEEEGLEEEEEEKPRQSLGREVNDWETECYSNLLQEGMSASYL